MTEITCDQLRDLVKELPLRELPSDFPDMPNGVPKTFQEALFFDDMCAIPLLGDDGYRFTIIGERGTKIEAHGELISFNTYSEAIDAIKGYKEYLRGGVG